MHTNERTPRNAQAMHTNAHHVTHTNQDTAGVRFCPPRFCVEGSSLLAPRVAKPWRGRTLEGSGGSGARFWTLAVLRGRVSTVGLQGRETLVGAYYSEGSGSSGARFWTPAVLRGRVVTFGLEGRKTVAGACSRGLWHER